MAKYKLPDDIDDKLSRITDLVEEMCIIDGRKDGFATGVQVGLNFALTTVTEMAHENFYPGGMEQEAVLSVGREIYSFMKEMNS